MALAEPTSEVHSYISVSDCGTGQDVPQKGDFRITLGKTKQFLMNITSIKFIWDYKPQKGTTGRGFVVDFFQIENKSIREFEKSQSRG